MIVLSCKLSKSQSRTSRMKQIQRDADLIREGFIKQWEAPELIRVKKDAESEISDRMKETERQKESRLERVDTLRWHSFGNTPSPT